MQPEYKSSLQHIVHISIHLKPYPSRPPSSALLRLYSKANKYRRKKYMVWHEAHNKDASVSHWRTEDSVDYTLVCPFMLLTYPRIDWLVFLAYFLLWNCSHNYDSASTPLTGIYPLRLWSLIVSRRFIFCTVPKLMLKYPPTSAIWLTWWSWICPLPTYMVTYLPSLVWSRTFYILVWMRLTYMVLSPPIWTTYSRSNASPSNCHSLLHRFKYLSSTTSVVVGFTHIVILMLKGFTKYISSYQVYFSCKIPPCHSMIYPT